MINRKLNYSLSTNLNEYVNTSLNTSFSFSILLLISLYTADLSALDLDYLSAEVSLSTAKQNLYNDDLLNLHNQFLVLADSSQNLNIRPELRLRWFDNLNLTFRPFFEVQQAKFITSQIEFKTTSKLRMNEFFLSQILTNTTQMTYGLQSYQWGPAEASSPSNFIFKDTFVAKDSLYLARGLHLLRFNFSPTQELSEIFMVELSDNGDADYYANKDEFSKKALLKSEWVWGQAADYFGVVLGWQDRLGFNLGEYLSTELSEGLYFYFDVHHKRGTERWRPAYDSNGLVVFIQDEKNKDVNYSYAVSGVRYNYENGGDLRLEYIYEEDAYSRAEQDLARNSFASQNPNQQFLFKDNLLHLFNNNLAFTGQKFLMLSYNKPNFLDKKNFIFAVRGLYSLADQSARAYFNFEKSLGVQGTLFVSVMQNNGRKNSELNTLVLDSYNLGYRHSF